MGVPKLFTVINKNNVTYSSIVENVDEQINIDYFYIDFNSIVHVTSQILVIELNEILLILLSLKSTNDLKQNDSIKKIIKKYSPYLNNFYDNFTVFDNEIMIGNEFNKYFSIYKIDEIVINLVKDDVHNLIKKFIKDKLKLLYIAIDGVPSKSKMVEQKQRRYIGAIISEYKKLLKDKYKNDLKVSNTLYGSNRLVYENSKISFNKSKISPGTQFMDILTSVLKKEKFNCNNYILSSIDEIGEGEKKIIDHIKKHNYNKCMIYSPDADIILLASLLDSTDNVILRHNQQKSTLDESYYDLINIDIFKNNIYDYLDDISVNKKSFIKDMICLASVFGNDFIPKIETIDVQLNFEQLLDVYLSTFKFFEGEIYLTEFRKNKYYLNNKFFIKFLEKYWDNELFNMKENYMINTYKMYKMFKMIYSQTSLNKKNNPNYVNHNNFEKFNMKFNEYTIKVFNLIKSVGVDNKNDNLKIVNNELDKLFNKDYNKKDYLNQLKQLVQYNLFKYLLPSDVKEYNDIKNYIILLTDLDFLKILIPVVKGNKENKIVRKYKDNVYQNTSKITRHQNAINNLIKKGEGTKYDKEYYIFSNMLDHYSLILKNKPLNLVNMTDNPKKTLSNFYKKFFNIDEYNFIENKYSIKKGVQTNKLENCIKRYIEGLMWTFNYYYNETNNVSNWFYDGERAPILRDIYIYLYNNPSSLEQAYNDLKIYDIDSLKNYFSTIEQLMYITPRIEENKELIPKKYLSFFNTDNYYVNINDIIKNLGKEVDCTGARYLNKCLIKSLKNYDMEYDKQFIKKLRLINLSRNINKYNKVKKKYIETGKLKFKKKYKLIKYKINNLRLKLYQ